jgi:hypothetical protein
MMSNNLRKRFVKDYRLPIVVMESPYFEYFIQLYDHLAAQEKYNKLVLLVERLGGEEAFFKESKRIIEAMTNYIKGQPKYEQFNSENLDSLTNGLLKKIQIPDQDIYIPQNDAKFMISVDLQKANFQCLKNYGIIEFDIYADFIGQYSADEYFQDSKQIRQVVFGQVNPKRQQILQRSMIAQAVQQLSEYKLISGTPDEVIFLFNSSEEMEAAEIRITEILSENFEWKFHVRGFQLNQIGKQPFYKKEFTDGSFELKNVPAHSYAEVLKYVLGRDISPQDRISIFEGRLVSFMNPLF